MRNCMEINASIVWERQIIYESAHITAERKFVQRESERKQESVCYKRLCSFNPDNRFAF